MQTNDAVNYVKGNANANPKDKDTDEHTRFLYIAVLGGLCIFLSAIEFVLPRPIPFFRYGLANIPILVALKHFRFLQVFYLVLIKVLGLAILNGTLVSYVFLFSLAGSLCSFLSMYGCIRVCASRISCIGLSVVGAFVSNGVQVLLAVYIIFGTKAIIILPLLIGMGMVSGLVVGICAEYYEKKSRFVDYYLRDYSAIEEAPLTKGKT